MAQQRIANATLDRTTIVSVQYINKLGKEHSATQRNMLDSTNFAMTMGFDATIQPSSMSRDKYCKHGAQVGKQLFHEDDFEFNESY